jgi:alpha-amylase/alpha-mannosidase (GH57 family)
MTPPLDGLNSLTESSIVTVEPTLTPAPVDVRSGVTPIAAPPVAFVTVHGHFYQPPREHPDLETIVHQPSASPFHDWNERIYHECYRPNAFARIFNDQGEVIAIVNNYEYLSFNMGPTLLSWLERYDPQVYQRILEADYKSQQRLQGHGNAIAQVYNHMILPLANPRDKVTQVRWGKADFRARFRRDPEGMWLAETAVDYATLEVLIAEGIKFIILAPSQAERCRPMSGPDAHRRNNPPQPEDPGYAEPDWLEVGGSQIDPTRPYRCYLPDRRYIDIFFYDGPISRDMGFSDALTSSQNLTTRLSQVIQGHHHPNQLVSVATDGETFGHHKSGGEKALAYAFISEFPQRGLMVTNYAHYLSLFPPTWEVELKPVTAWSCAHGVDRWQDDCGCGGEGGVWHQKWRRPLRQSLDWLRDQLATIYTSVGSQLFLDPWQTRDDYIEVILSRGLSNSPLGLESGDHVERFLTLHQRQPLTPSEQVDALRLLEMQRMALLMYTSCGWFFEELSRPEGVQILRYAGRAIYLAEAVTGMPLETEFIERLSQAPSNIELFRHGGEVYRQLVKPSQLNLEQVAAHFAISSLFANYPSQHRLFCYHIQQQDYQLQRLGVLTLAVGQLQVTSELTREMAHLNFAVLHLGGWDFHCVVQAHQGRGAYSQLKQKLLAALHEGSAAKIVLAMTAHLGNTPYTLDDLFPEERQRLMTLLTQETLIRLEQLYNQVYRDNYGMLLGWQRDGLAVPQELQVAAQITLSHRLYRCVQGLEQELTGLDWQDPRTLDAGSNYFSALASTATEAQALRCQLNLEQIQPTMERLVSALVWQLVHQAPADTQREDTPSSVSIPAGLLNCLQQLTQSAQQLGMHLNIDPAQELVWHYLQQMTARGYQGSSDSLQRLGQCLRVEVH